jgi:hypothetical protein
MKKRHFLQASAALLGTVIISQSQTRQAGGDRRRGRRDPCQTRQDRPREPERAGTGNSGR